MPRTKTESCSRCDKPMWKSRTSAESPVCRECRTIERGCTSSYYKGCRCDACKFANGGRYKASAECATRARAWRNSNRDKVRDYEREWYERVSSERVGNFKCQVCGATYERLVYRQARTTCSEVCRYFLCYQRWPSSRIGNATQPRGCAACGVEFTPRAANGKYCSRLCKSSVRWSRGILPRIRRQVFDRDGWICQICLEPVDKDADPRSDWYPSIDHITPRSRGGGDEVNNLRCAHRWCNSVRGDETYYTDDDLRVARVGDHLPGAA